MTVHIYESKNNANAINATNATIVFSSGLGGHGHFWQPQIAYFTQFFRVICYDHEGVAPQSQPLPNHYRMENLADQLIMLLDAHHVKQAHFVGHALGGFIGLEVAKKRPDLLDKLVLINVWDELDVHTQKCFSARKSLLLDSGIEAYVRAQALFLYPPIWISNHISQLTEQENKMIENFTPIENVLTRLQALQAYHPLNTATAINQATLILINQDDFLVPWQRGLALATKMKNATFELMPTGAHASTITQADEVNHKIAKFLNHH